MVLAMTQGEQLMAVTRRMRLDPYCSLQLAVSWPARRQRAAQQDRQQLPEWLTVTAAAADRSR